MRSTRTAAPPSCTAVCLATEDTVYLDAALTPGSGGSAVYTAGSRGAALPTPPG